MVKLVAIFIIPKLIQIFFQKNLEVDLILCGIGLNNGLAHGSISARTCTKKNAKYAKNFNDHESMYHESVGVVVELQKKISH